MTPVHILRVRTFQNPPRLFEGEFPISRIYQGSQALLINYLYFCPVCGEVWAKLWFEPHPTYDNKPPRWEALAVNCRAHGGGYLFPPHWPIQAILPIDLLRHDAELYIHANNPPFTS